MSLWLTLVAPSMAEDVSVEALVVKSQPIFEEVSLSGTLTSPHLSLVSTQIAGLVEKILADATDEVKAGQPLLMLDSELSSIALEAAKARLESARQTYQDSQRRYREAQALVGDKSIAQSEVDARMAQMGIDAARLKEAEVEVQNQQARLARHTIRAPFDGVISRRLVDIGEWVAPGEGLVELVGRERLWVDFQVPQRFYPLLGGDSKVQLRFDALPGLTLEKTPLGRVPLSSGSARTFLLRVEMQRSKLASLIPGMSSNAVLQLDLKRENVVVPRDALIRYPDGRISVWVSQKHVSFGQSAEVVERMVNLGLGFGDWVEITSGLAANELVVVKGNEALREGKTVRFLAYEKGR
ncbi:efflux RND transporter periplasmic adaptor subunit [Aliiglaciecola sp. CAU 1673]|uniref:efflux RND transporter periplasmic adaptor subunit n=1 Tax=Aliiglaciecola sp. CAU 1673 TaxID=3032595 RepID=UPI0023DC7C53|nr:efflux RND transporter periplasmic adaptor subunit [Aliiglaciecola sp. CAU 1673]MDF2176741.1 efflux RND transporter periplasmic adaptor subunit [Aliiglaciecola sp. CAU 1673]